MGGKGWGGPRGDPLGSGVHSPPLVLGSRLWSRFGSLGWGCSGATKEGAVGQALRREKRHVLLGSPADRGDAEGLMPALSEKGLLSGPPWDPLGLALPRLGCRGCPRPVVSWCLGWLGEGTRGWGSGEDRGDPCSMGLVGKTAWALGWGGPFRVSAKWWWSWALACVPFGPLCLIHMVAT